jgi:hypothetical protein
MYRYLVDFVCTRNGLRTYGSQLIERPQQIPWSTQAERENFTDGFRQLVAQNTGDNITALTITDFRLS